MYFHFSVKCESGGNDIVDILLLGILYCYFTHLSFPSHWIPELLCHGSLIQMSALKF